MKKKIVSLFMSIVLIATMLCALGLNASAASASSTFDCDETVTFTVKTGSKGTASIKFTSTVKSEKATVNRLLFGKKTYTHTCAHAPKMVVEVSPAIKGKTVFYVQDTFSLNGFRSISSTLKFDKCNTKYTVKVHLLKSKDNHCTLKNSEVGMFHNDDILQGYGYTAYCNGTWKMSNSNCTISNIKVR